MNYGTDFSEALVTLMADMPNVTKGKEGYGYKYVDFAEVIEKTRPVLKAHGFAVVQTVGGEGENIRITTRLIHRTGQEIVDTFAVPPVVLKGTNTAQQLGAAVTYGRRYGWVTLLGLAADEDTDGMPGKKQEQEKTYTRPVKSEPEIHKPAQDDKKQALHDLGEYVKSTGWSPDIVTAKVVMRYKDLPLTEAGGLKWEDITAPQVKAIHKHLQTEQLMEVM
jgi:hypothetical protein